MLTATNRLLDPRKFPQQARSRALVDAILDAAARILAKDGRESLTTNAVAVKAGVSIGSLYQYFPNREAVIAAVAERHGQLVYRQVADLDLSNESTLEGAVARIVSALFAAHRIEPALHEALHGDLAHSHGRNGQRHEEHNHHHGDRHDHTHMGTKAAMVAQLSTLSVSAAGEIRRADIILAAVTVSEIVHAMAHTAIIHSDERFSPEHFEREATRAALAYLKIDQ